MPEIWIPYGETETLITLGAENLGELVEPAQDGIAEEEMESLKLKIPEFGEVVVCDYKPSTIEVLKKVLSSLTAESSPRVYSSSPKKLESHLPDLKGRVQRPDDKVVLQTGREVELKAPNQLTDDTPKLVISTAEPDPLMGLVDSRIALCLSFVTNVRQFAYASRSSDEPAPFSQTASAEALIGIAERFPNTTYVTVVPRGSKPHRLLWNAPMDAVKNSFVSLTAPQARAGIIGIGGRGYDDTFSNALRLVWGSLNCVRQSGEVLLICECGDGLGSDALEMLVAGRLDEGGPKKREGYVQGQEELHYLKRLKSTYGVILMSGLPELYARAKLGLTTARGSGEAVGKLLGRLGRTTKVNVVTRASECSLSGT